MRRVIPNHPVHPRAGPILAFLIGASLSSAPLDAQFGTPGATPVRQRIAGVLLTAPDGPEPEPGDELGVFYNEQLAGSFTFTSETVATQYEITIFGDDPTTPEPEGPPRGSIVDVRFFDASTNSVRRDLRFENVLGEAFNYRYAGDSLPAEFEGLPFPVDLTPTIELNLRLGAQAESPARATGAAQGQSADVDANGIIETQDAVLVLRIVAGASRAVSAAEIARADVNGDGVISTADAIDVLRQR